jgi:LPXTG-motif cell wall-anchored protein
VYQQTGGAALIGSGAALPFTGSNSVWMFVAGFTLVSAGIAVLRIIPRRRST